MANPYESARETNNQWTNVPGYESMGPNPEYAAPSLAEGSPWVDEPANGWGPELENRNLTVPDAHRLGTLPQHDFYPDDQENARGFFRQRDIEKDTRHRQEDIDANGWAIEKGSKKVGVNPREIPPPETRPTERLSPNTYSFTRPFDQQAKGNGARRFNGNHFSMADHRRNYEILGMAPWTAHRNTYRIEPTPWDNDIVDMPPSYEPDAIPARIRAINMPPAQDRSWRLS